MPAPGDVLLVSFDGTWHGQKILNTFYYGISTLIGAPTTAAYIAAFDTAINTAGNLRPRFLAACPPQYTMNNTWYQFVTPVRLRKQVYAVAAPGTFIQMSSTANLAATITRRGDVANKHNIGSLHVPTSNLDPGMASGILSVAVISALNNLVTSMLAPVTVGAFGSAIPILWYKPLAANATPITNATVQQTVRVMRRRTVGVGK